MSKKNLYNHVALIIAGTCVLSFSTACSKGKSGPASGSAKENILSNTKYRANFHPMNSSVTGMTHGFLEIKVDGDSFDVQMHVKDAPTFTTHSQYIYEAKECPTMADDKNNDEFIDPIEAQKVHGKALIPLDGDVSAQEIGINEFPEASGIGSYMYEQSVSYSKMVADLQAPDLDPKDYLGKIGHNKNLALEGKIVIIHGIPEDAYLPATVDVASGQSVRRQLAIACGKLMKVQEDEI